MGLFDDLKLQEKQWPCKVRVLMDSLDKNDREILTNIMLDKRWTNEALARAINERGFNIVGITLGRHRRGACSCSRD
jgi:hypothetical protein